MIKKFSLVVFSLVIFLTMCFSVVACSGGSFDSSALQKQIDELKANNDKLQGELNTNKTELDNLKSKNYDDSALKSRIAELEEQLSGMWGSVVPVFNLGETFTYVDGTVEKFSIIIDVAPNPNNITITVKNIGMSGAVPADIFLTLKYIRSYTEFSLSLDSTSVPVGGTHSQTRNIGNATLMYLMPNTAGAVMPYAIFKLI